MGQGGWRRISPYLLLSLASLFWAGNVVIARAMRADIPPVGMGLWRWLIAGILLLPFVANELARAGPVIRRSWRLLLALGVLSVSLFNTMCYIGLQTTTANNGALFNSLIPVLIVLLSWLWLRKRPSARQTTGIGASLLGVLVIVAQGRLHTLLALQLNAGDLWILSAMVLWAAYTILLRWKPAELSSLAFLACIIWFGLPLLIAWYVWELGSGARFALTPATAATLAYFGIFPSLLAYWCFNRGVAELGASRAGIFIHLMPVFGILLSTVLLQEPPQLYFLAGMVLVFWGIWMSSTSREASLGPARSG